jgi:hypothetical protein
MSLEWRKTGYRNEARRYGSVPDPGTVWFQQFYISNNMSLEWRKTGYRNEARRYGSVPDPGTVGLDRNSFFFIFN